MLEFRSYASGSGGNFYVASAGEARLAIECGLRFSDIRKALGFSVTGLDGCLVSHAHGDHARAAFDMTRAGVDVWASKDTWDQLVAGDRSNAAYPGHRAKTLVPGTPQSVRGWQVLPFEVAHDCPGTLGFLIAGPSGEQLVYLTDAPYSPFRFEGVKIFAVECNHSSQIIRANAERGQIDRSRYHRTARTHMSLERLIDMLKANDLSTVEEIHLLHLSSENSDEAAFKTAVERATGRPVYVAAERSLEA